MSLWKSSSTKPSQSLSMLSQVSNDGVPKLRQVGAPPSHDSVPCAHTPTLAVHVPPPHSALVWQILPFSALPRQVLIPHAPMFVRPSSNEPSQLLSFRSQSSGSIV